MIGTETGIYGLQFDKTADHQTRADQEYNGQSDLRNDQSAAQATAADGGHRASASGFEDFIELNTCSRYGRSQPEQQSSEDGDHKRECQYAPVNRDFIDTGDIAWTQGHKHSDADIREGQS